MNFTPASPTPNQSTPISVLPALRSILFLGLATEAIYIIYILAFPLIANTQKGGPAADLEILMRDFRWFAPIYTLGILLLYYLFWQVMKRVSSVRLRPEVSTVRLDRTAQPEGCQVSRDEASTRSNTRSSLLSRLRFASPLRVSPLASLKLLILAFGLLFGFTLIWLYPITAIDLFCYAVRARIWALYGASPMLTPANTFPNDPYLSFAGEYAGWLSVYGPLWEIITQIPVRLLGMTGIVSASIGLKVVALVFYLAGAVLLGWFAKPQHGSSLAALTFFAWNPLVLMQVMGNGHNDMVFMTLLVLGLVLWQRRLWAAAVLALTLAALSKISAALIIPLFAAALLRDEPAWRGRVVKMAGAVIMGLTVSYLVYAVHGPLPLIFQDTWNILTTRLDFILSASAPLKAGWAWLTAWLGFALPSPDAPPGLGALLATRRGFAIPSLARMVLREIIPWSVAENLPRTAADIIFLGFYLWLVAQVWRKKLDLIAAGFLAYFGEVSLGPTFRIWYPLWLIPLAALNLTPATFWRTTLFGLTAELSIINYFVVWRWWLSKLSWDWLHLLTKLYYWPVMHSLTVPWTFGLPLFGPIFIERRQKKNSKIVKF